MERTIVASYREFAPHRALRDHVRAFFSFVPGDQPCAADPSVTRQVLFAEGDSFCSPLLAAGNASLVLDLGATCSASGVWRTTHLGPHGKIIGAMTHVGPSDLTERPAMIGVYFHPATIADFIGVPATEVTDRIVDLEEFWGARGVDLPVQIAELGERDGLAGLELELLRRLDSGPSSGTAIDVAGLSAWVLESRGRLTVDRLARGAGISRQHLTRAFHESVGLSPKLYCRLARFHAGLAYATDVADLEWARVAAELGYADQSHMIAEFREFSSLTPQQLVAGRWFHPFIENARSMPWFDRRPR
jgi:AraC-like DNA-binding protein